MRKIGKVTSKVQIETFKLKKGDGIMKKIMLGVVLGLLLTGCASMFNKTDPMVQEMAQNYQMIKSNVELTTELLETFDAVAYPEIKETYYNGDTFTVAFNSLSDTKQLNLVKLNEKYLKLKEKYPSYKESMNKAFSSSESLYNKYYKVRKISLNTEKFIKELPSVISGLKLFRK